MKKVLVLSVMSMGLFGCNATTTAELNCNPADGWAALGQSVGQEGKSVRDFDRFKNSCNNLSGSAKSEFITGYTVGIKNFCNYENGVKIASEGLPNNNICPLEMRNMFNKGYANGLAVREENLRKLRRTQQARDEIQTASEYKKVGG
ncbi:DUF2799 domain-containing protein [Pseudoalteromonas aurantia]|uniref:DUF2799 domain-containing protein n=1 Tax=Pseudoalteromonas aurantia TaxID=43654 RepID=A0A5S3V8P2_9GAMM|nr:DUF2799 domain-containing protein [Pseudoalteromonas aurantia]TMO67803.1 hypothetical protein CWC19_11965 [Pseudoalteromonas aurantia]TMO78173.1 hypothetical protein CWC20_02070 [Pseudoalteromonas aurantia]